MRQRRQLAVPKQNPNDQSSSTDQPHPRPADLACPCLVGPGSWPTNRTYPVGNDPQGQSSHTEDCQHATEVSPQDTKAHTNPQGTSGSKGHPCGILKNQHNGSPPGRPRPPDHLTHSREPFPCPPNQNMYIYTRKQKYQHPRRQQGSPHSQSQYCTKLQPSCTQHQERRI